MESFNIIARTKQELQRLLLSYQQAIDFNIICSVTDPKGTILYVNKVFCEISKYSRKELIGQNHRLINSGFHPKEFFNQMWQTIGKGKVWRGEIKNNAKDGTFYWVDTVILPIKDKHENIIQFFSLRQPITDRKNIEEERQKYTKALREMLFMTSHRVRKPLTTCLGIMEMVETDILLSPADLKNVVQHLKSSALELDAFTKELTIFIYDIEQKYENKTGA